MEWYGKLDCLTKFSPESGGCPATCKLYDAIYFLLADLYEPDKSARGNYQIHGRLAQDKIFHKSESGLERSGFQFSVCTQSYGFFGGGFLWFCTSRTCVSAHTRLIRGPWKGLYISPCQLCSVAL